MQSLTSLPRLSVKLTKLLHPLLYDFHYYLLENTIHENFLYYSFNHLMDE